MNIAIVGSRTFKDKDLLFTEVQNYIIENNINDVKIISGGAKGADTYARLFANKYNYELVEYIPEWDKYGKSAGMKRNALIINDADIVFAFWDGLSKGTKNSIDTAKKLKRKIILYEY